MIQRIIQFEFFRRTLPSDKTRDSICTVLSAVSQSHPCMMAALSAASAMQLSSGVGRLSYRKRQCAPCFFPLRFMADFLQMESLFSERAAQLFILLPRLVTSNLSRQVHSKGAVHAARGLLGSFPPSSHQPQRPANGKCGVNFPMKPGEERDLQTGQATGHPPIGDSSPS